MLRQWQMQMGATLVLAGVLGLTAPSSLADHPNQGSATLKNLVEQALGANPQIREAEQSYKAAQRQAQSTWAPYLPQISLEGGQQQLRLDSQTDSGSFGYGLAQWNLYRGGQDQARREQLLIDEEFFRTQLEQAKARVEREVSRLFSQLLYLQEAIAVKNEALEANRNQLTQAQRKQGAGFTSKADVLEFELREATLRSDLNLLSQEETTKERELRLLLNQTSAEPIRVGGHLHRDKLKASPQDLVAEGLRSQEDLRRATRDLQQSQLQSRILKGDYLPRIDFEGKYGHLFSEEASPRASDDYSLMLKVSLPIFSGLETTQLSRAQKEMVARETIAVERLKIELQTKVESAVARLRSIEQRLDLEEQNIERSKQYYTITLAEYKRGVKNSPDVAGAAERLFDSRLRNLEYRKDYYLTCIDLAETVGTNGNGIFR